MKKLSQIRTALFAAIALMAAASFTACGDGELTKRAAKNALEEHPQLRDSSEVVGFATGYYEVNATDMNGLAELRAAEMITCKFDTVVEHKKRWSWREGDYFEDIQHIYANVAFTEKGQEYVVTKVPSMREDQEEDMKSKEEKFHDFMLNAIQKGTEAIDQVAIDSLADEEAVVETEQKSAYELAEEKVNRVHHTMLAGYIEVVKVKEIFCTEEMRKHGRGECLAICEFTDRTPFGGVLTNIRNGQRFMLKAEFIYYNDMGWVATDLKSE